MSAKVAGTRENACMHKDPKGRWHCTMKRGHEGLHFGGYSWTELPNELNKERQWPNDTGEPIGPSIATVEIAMPRRNNELRSSYTQE